MQKGKGGEEMERGDLNAETQALFDALPVGLRETILQSGASFQSASELRTLIAGFDPSDNLKS